MLTPPMGKPEGWDASDAISEGFDIEDFLLIQKSQVKEDKRSICLTSTFSVVSRFAGDCAGSEVPD